MRVLVLWSVAAVFLGCGRSGVVDDPAVDAGAVRDGGTDAGRVSQTDAGVDAGVDAGTWPTLPDETFAQVELFTDERILGLSLVAYDDGFLAVWVAGWTFPTTRMLSLSLNLEGQPRNLMQTLGTWTLGGGARARLLPGALQSTGKDRFQVTAAVGAEASVWTLDRQGFPQGKLLERPLADPNWAVFSGERLLASHGLDASLTEPSGTVWGLPGWGSGSTSCGAAANGQFSVLSGKDGVVKLQSLEARGPGSAPVWREVAVVGQAPPALPGGTPSADALVLRPSGSSWLTAWAELSNPRQVDLRVRRLDGASQLVEAQTAYYRTDADVVDTGSGAQASWAAAWTSFAGGGYNHAVRFRRSEATTACTLNEGFTADASSGPVALARHPSGRLGALWAEPVRGPNGQYDRSRLVFRSLGTGYCAR